MRSSQERPVSEMSDDEYYAKYPPATGLPSMRFFHSRHVLAHVETNPPGQENQIVVYTPPVTQNEVPQASRPSCIIM